MIVVVTALIMLHGPDDQIIWVNPSEIVSVRAPRETHTAHFGPNINCLLQTADGKWINVTDTCDVVIDALRGAR